MKQQLVFNTTKKAASHANRGGWQQAGKGKGLSLQRSAVNRDAPDVAPPIVHDVLRSPGRPLDGNIRSTMESRLGNDFSHVRVHTDTHAAESANAVNAHAYTVGRNVVFGRNQYAPGTDTGRKMLAHELVHTLQQQGGSFQGAPKQHTTSPSAIHEKEASTLARNVVWREKPDSYILTAGNPKSGVPVQVSPLPASVSLLQRQERPRSQSVGSLSRLERLYRYSARELGDPQLQEAALNVATCIEQEGRGAFCETLVTDDDLWHMYGEYSLIEDVLGTERADAALRDHNLTSVAAEAVGGEVAATGSGATAPAAGVAVAGAAPALPQAPVGPAPTAPTRPPLRVIPGGGGAPAPRSVPRAPGGAVGPVIVIAVGIAVYVQLSEYGAFQTKAFDAGYRYLPSGYGVCMRGCHSPRAPQRTQPPFEFPLPEPEPLTPAETDQLRDWIRQLPPISGPQEEPGEGTAPIPVPRTERRRSRPYRPSCKRG